MVWRIAIVMTALSSFAFAADAPKRPNIVFILQDDGGYADTGCYGSKEVKTPHIDRIAREGVRMTDFYVAPVCTPTRAAFITGRWQQRVGLEWAIYPGVKEPGLPTSETSIARMLKDVGYQTAMFGKWHLGYNPEFGPNAHGFDEFFGLLSGNIDHYSHKENNDEADLYENTTPVTKTGYMTDLITDRATAYIDKAAGKPFFLYVPYNAVHWPFQPPDHPETVRTKKTWFDGSRADYVKMCERVDDGVGKIIAALEKNKVLDDTLLVFANDNGGERHSDNSPLSGRKGTLWEGGIRVNCVLRWPGRVPAGKAVAQPSVVMDLTATFLSAAGAAPPAARALDGIDLLPILAVTAPPVERTFYFRIDRKERKQKAVRKGDWKWLRDGETEKLFNLAEDIAEKHDVAKEHADKAAELRTLMAGWEADLAKNPPKFTVK